ncbi:hypothetical protein [Sodalis endosymbiont of Henestaris halophilus]|uniref:hypothetical protein n=1 Tax=Sodalis endosymbiont of Henestaris halophilus TaxID=1929246 RepID=UPI000BE39B5E|nr:hypothetical protein [Sodalis endosymbiont of Henestaris halophilus]
MCRNNTGDSADVQVFLGVRLWAVLKALSSGNELLTANNFGRDRQYGDARFSIVVRLITQ